MARTFDIKYCQNFKWFAVTFRTLNQKNNGWSSMPNHIKGTQNMRFSIMVVSLVYIMRKTGPRKMRTGWPSGLRRQSVEQKVPGSNPGVGGAVFSERW